MFLRRIQVSKFLVVLILLVSATSIADDTEMFPMQTGDYNDSWKSLQQYQCPEWFRDAKFGIWAIIGPQCVPMQGDWYARHMYIQGHHQYNYHVSRYGHPSEFGYKNLIDLFDPVKLNYNNLISLYKQAGAKYAVILAVHHDNFDLWDSKHHPWNSIKKGPRRDLVGEFRDASLRHDLRFGVTTHLARSYGWFQTNKDADKTGPFKDTPYDGTQPQFEDLYHPPFEQSEKTYYQVRYPKNPPLSWKENWYLRMKDLIDKYQPDLMYFDGGYPFDDGSTGRRLVAHYYNSNAIWHKGTNEAVMCVKDHADHGVFKEGTSIKQIERGIAADIAEQPWQTGSCIGNWYYKTGIRYKSVKQVVHMLIDIVSKNGNLMLNIPLHPDGHIDLQEEDFLKGMGKWMNINGSALYETRPWIVFGEGEVKTKSGSFSEGMNPYSTKDFRYTAKGDKILNAFFMAWPTDGKLTLKALASTQGATAQITGIQLYGHEGKLAYEHDSECLKVVLPKQKPCDHAWVLKITGIKLRDFSHTKTR